MGGDTARVIGSVHTKLTGGKAVDLPIVWDSGCSKDIISEEIVRPLGVNNSELDRPLRIMTASVPQLITLTSCAHVISKSKHWSQAGGGRCLTALYSGVIRQRGKFGFESIDEYVH